MDEKRYWIGFILVKGIGAVRFQRLLDRFGSAEFAWTASPVALADAGLSLKLIEQVVAIRQKVDLNHLLEQIQVQNIQILTWDKDDYPRHLKEIDQPPLVLFMPGSLLPEDHFAVAIVGTRRVSAYGRQVTEEVATFLAANGVTVVSGLAQGVDTIAHQSALKAGGCSLAVLGLGVDRIYPPEHRTLAELMMAHGATLSEYAPGTPPKSLNFPPRNRIISGLSMAVVVI